MNKIISEYPKNQIWPRSGVIKILSAALELKEFRFANQFSLAWLASFPGDLNIKFLQSKSLIGDGLGYQAVKILENLVNSDPEYLEAQKLLAKIGVGYLEAGIDEINGCVKVLTNRKNQSNQEGNKQGDWPNQLVKVREYQAKGLPSNAIENLKEALGTASNLPLTGIIHLEYLRSQDNPDHKTIQNIAELYHERWPTCIQFMIILAETLLSNGEAEEAVELLHRAASKDISGQVATRIWGSEHQFKKLWPQNINAIINIPLPSNIATFLGWNLLPQPQHSKQGILTKKHETMNLKTEVVEQTSNILGSDKNVPKVKPDNPNDKKKKVNRKYSNGRFPVYVLFTSKSELEKKYGKKTFNILEQEMRKLVSVIRTRMDWGAILIFSDDPNSMAQYGLKPVPTDPWQLKLALKDLDSALGDRGARIGAILIVGGPDIIPFHNLPNPTDDSDTYIPSDNPYSTSDPNYFLPEWPLGRLPGGEGKDPGALMHGLREITKTHTHNNKVPKGVFRTFLKAIIKRILPRLFSKHTSFGFTAEAWKKASSSVFRSIGDPRELITSPPIEINRSNPMPSTTMGYFNLHGVVDSPEWFGQKNPQNNNNEPDFPTALQPKDLPYGGKTTKVIFTEACYGANILNKNTEDSLALKFLASGTQALIGSTVISYGSITTPLNAADLLGKAFWNYFKDGYTAGESLQKAKIYMASEMQRRQGYLDGEDQKTLISFVLYGDPLANEDSNKLKIPRKLNSIAHAQNEVKTICDRVDIPGTSEPIPKEIIENVKGFVEQYLPGMRDAQLILSHEHATCCCEGHTCPTSHLRAKNAHRLSPERRLVTLSKEVISASKTHETFARMTFNKDGKMVKLAISR